MKKIAFFMAIILTVIAVNPSAFAAGEENYCLVVTDTVAADSGVDVYAELQQLIDENPNRTIYFPDGEYLVSQPLKTPANPKKSVSLRLADFAVIKAVGDWDGAGAVVQLGGKDPYNDTHTNGSNYSLEGGIIDGSDVADGISINSGRETAVRNCSIKNTVIGIHVMYGINSGSSDSDISGISIIGTGKTDSVGIFLEGYDNTVTNVRIGDVFIGVHVKSGGNILRNVHPLYTSDYTDFANSCGFLNENSNNWFDYCYSDQFATAFRTTGYGVSKYHNCFCYWYSSREGTHTAFRADKEFKSIVTNFTVGFNGDAERNVVLSVGAIGGNGTIENLDVDEFKASDKAYKAYEKDALFIERVFGFTVLLFKVIFGIR